MEMSIAEESDMYNVRGIGVAVIYSVSTLALSCLIFSFASTPNLCSSSTMRRPRSWNFASPERRRWVPMMISTSPFSSLSRICFCSYFFLKRESTSTFAAYSESLSRNVL